MAAKNIVNKDQYLKALRNAHTRINNVDRVFGGVMEEAHRRWNPELWTKKQKALNDIKDLQNTYGHLLKEDV